MTLVKTIVCMARLNDKPIAAIIQATTGSNYEYAVKWVNGQLEGVDSITEGKAAIWLRCPEATITDK